MALKRLLSQVFYMPLSNLPLLRHLPKTPGVQTFALIAGLKFWQDNQATLARA